MLKSLITYRPYRSIYTNARIILVLLAVLVMIPAVAQNTKGDKPVGNQKKIRETKVKSVKRKEKGTTKDIAGRRLRTKDKSSAKRANVGIKQPDPYAKRKRVTSDRPAKVRTPSYSQKPSERSRAWRGDISGFAQLKVKPRKAEAARSNVFPQNSPWVNSVSKKPTGEQSHRVHTRTSTGKPIVRREPQHEERAWRGNIRGGPVGTPSRSGRVRNIHPQENEYSRYSEKTRNREISYSNKATVARAARMGTDPRPRGRTFGTGPFPVSGPFIQGGRRASSGSRSFIQRGRKNVYWGKFSKGERPVTTDLTGRPVRTKNFRSVPAGLVGRDTLKFFGRRPGGDLSFKGQRQGGFIPAKPSQQRGWKGDVAGWNLRRLQPHSNEKAGRMVFPRKLSNSNLKEKAGRPLPGAPFPAAGRSGDGKVGQRVAPRPPGVGAIILSRALGRYKGNKPVKAGGSVSGKLWNNNRTAIQGRVLPAGADRAGGFSGNLRGGQGKTFQDQGEGFSGFIKARKPLKGGGSVSGKLWNNSRTAIQGRVLPAGADRAGGFSGNLRGGQGKIFQDQGEGFSGFIKARKPLKGGGSVSGKLWNNNRTAIQGRVLPSGADRAGGFSGNLRGGQGKIFQDQGEGFSGYIKARKPLKGGGSVSGKLWNNDRTPIQVRVLPAGADRAGGFSGNLKGGEGKIYEDQGEGFSGYIKAKKPVKGGGSISGKLWNNREESTTVPVAGKSSLRAGQFQGTTKAKEPAKGGGSLSGKLWNNKEKPVTVMKGGKSSVNASGFVGNTKAKEPSKGGGGSVSGKIWNNKEEPIQVKVSTLSDAKGAGFGGNNKIKRAYTQNPNASEESLKKRKPGKTLYMVEGLQVKVREENFGKRDHSVKGSMPGVGPKKGSVKASEFDSGIKMMNTKHNPNSADGALKVVYLGKAAGRVQDFQGNVKMRKFNSRHLHPDAQFAHSAQNNVKEERTILLNVKLFWSKLFHKTEAQPDHLKEKVRSPKYDKGEKGMWND